MKISKKQKNKFIEAAREAECSEDEAEFDRNLKRIANQPRTQPRTVMPKKGTMNHKGGVQRLAGENDK